MVYDQYDREESKRKSALSQIEFSRQKNSKWANQLWTQNLWCPMSSGMLKKKKKKNYRNIRRWR